MYPGETVNKAFEFHRIVRLYYFPLAVIGAIGVAFAFPPTPDLVLAALVMAVGVVICVVPYWADKIMFHGDGSLTVGRGSAVHAGDVSKCTYRIVAPGPGRVLRWFVFALYTQTNPDVPCEIIPTRGWRTADRKKLFREFSSWVLQGDVKLDEQTLTHLQRLQGLDQP